jgi:hypothetical protein
VFSRSTLRWLWRDGRCSKMKPAAHQTKSTLVMPTKMMRFDTQAAAEVELTKVTARGDRGYLLPPIEAKL